MSEPKDLEGPPVLIIGGDAAVLSIARSLSARGIRVRALAEPSSPIRHSRSVELIPLAGERFFENVAEFLLGPDSEALHGSVLFAVSDSGLSLLIENRAALEDRFLLDRSNLDAQRCMLDKIATYEAASAAGVPTPRFWIVQDDLSEVADELVFPLIVKPRHAHVASVLLKRKKYVRADNLEEAQSAVEWLSSAGVESFLVEMIPGPDTLLCSYYTYLDEHGTSYFDFTKRVVRRCPKNRGLATLHVTDHVEGLKELSLRLWRHVGVQGLANAEYKLDERDGVYKLIECNCRFTGGTPVAAACGRDLADFTYRQVVGLEPAELGEFEDDVFYWVPRRDFAAFRELRRLGELSLLGWLRSTLHRTTLPLWSWRDPVPSIVNSVQTVAGLFTRVLGQRTG
jgi:predicted ATP-grasp superfamily ATP-dependent carboligase